MLCILSIALTAVVSDLTYNFTSNSTLVLAFGVLYSFINQWSSEHTKTKQRSCVTFYENRFCVDARPRFEIAHHGEALYGYDSSESKKASTCKLNA
jgi:hypothetical protein